MIRSVREERGLTQARVAEVCGVSRVAVGQWEKGDNEPSAERLLKLGDVLGIDMEAALRGERVLRTALGDAPAQRPRPRPAPNAQRAPEPAGDASRFIGPRDVPVMGTVVGGPSGDFRFNGEIIDYAPRPPGIAKRKDVFAMYVRGDSMAPAHEDGTRVWVDKHRPPGPRDYVVIELHSSNEEPGESFIKRLVRATSKTITVEQYQPPDTFEFDTKDVANLYRVIPWEELLGV